MELMVLEKGLSYSESQLGFRTAQILGVVFD